MTMTGYLLGHKIVWDGSEWRFADNNDPTVTTFETRNCFKCDKPPTDERHDPCIANLPNVMNACCGHGILSQAYVMFKDKSCQRGKKAELYFKKHNGKS